MGAHEYSSLLWTRAPAFQHQRPLSASPCPTWAHSEGHLLNEAHTVTKPHSFHATYLLTEDPNAQESRAPGEAGSLGWEQRVLTSPLCFSVILNFLHVFLISAFECSTMSICYFYNQKNKHAAYYFK